MHKERNFSRTTTIPHSTFLLIPCHSQATAAAAEVPRILNIFTMHCLVLVCISYVALLGKDITVLMPRASILNIKCAG